MLPLCCHCVSHLRVFIHFRKTKRRVLQRIPHHSLSHPLILVTAKALRGVAGAIDPLVPVPMAPEGAGGSVSRHEPDSFSRAELEEYLDEYACMEEQALAMEIEKQRAEKMLAELESSKSALEAQVLEIEAERKDMKQVGRG